MAIFWSNKVCGYAMRAVESTDDARDQGNAIYLLTPRYCMLNLHMYSTVKWGKFFRSFGFWINLSHSRE